MNALIENDINSGAGLGLQHQIIGGKMQYCYINLAFSTSATRYCQRS
jgi:hypothetical protein